MSDSEKFFRWGIVGTSKVAAEFASQLGTISNARIHGILSGNHANAEVFRTEFAAERTFKTFEQMLEDTAIDVIYIALPASLHMDFCIRALQAKKPIVCEKPFAMNYEEVQKILSVSREENVFCMEAMWMRFSPIIKQIHSMVEAGDFGVIRSIDIQAGNVAPVSRLDSTELGRGALLNFGVYGASLAQLFLGESDDVVARADLLENGVDASCSLIFKYPSAMATVAASVQSPMSNEAIITGTKARARIGGPFFSPGFAEITFYKEAGKQTPERHTPIKHVKKVDRLPYLGLAQGAFWASMLRRRGKLLVRRRGDNGMRLEAIEAMNCINSLSRESEVVSHASSLSVARMLDRARKSADS